ncbi:two-component response regulator [Scytonema sp. HK-05]|uniref:response regulator n=1 Tax=Scytonema sp. HK-05 TaxID=1137095 RepID=UPI000935DD1E|nr:response regulator [Scytonema sp. HK-05]OKH59201.1 two-component system response regulator [Scytonema sp. HK-05]BAY45420.1 two-component response regulator [Scytonema sp. HK-05]
MTATHTILLVEDDPNDILLTQRAFRKANLTNASLQVVTDGDSAVAYLSGEGEYSDRDRYPLPVVILLDIKLPRRSGHEVLAWLKHQPELKRLLVVVLTSSNQRSDVDQAYDLGANSYLLKPIGLAALVQVVQALNLYWLLLNEKPEIRQS